MQNGEDIYGSKWNIPEIGVEENDLEQDITESRIHAQMLN